MTSVALSYSVGQEWPRQTKPKKGQLINFLQSHSGTKVQCESCLFSQGKTPEFTKMGEIHELFVLPLSLVWFAGATPNLGREHFGTRPCQSPSRFGIRLHFVRPHFPSPNPERAKRQSIGDPHAMDSVSLLSSLLRAGAVKVQNCLQWGWSNLVDPRGRRKFVY